MRGFLGGALCGGVLSAGVLAASSSMVPMPDSASLAASVAMSSEKSASKSLPKVEKNNSNEVAAKTATKPTPKVVKAPVKAIVDTAEKASVPPTVGTVIAGFASAPSADVTVKPVHLAMAKDESPAAAGLSVSAPATPEAFDTVIVDTAPAERPEVPQDTSQKMAVAPQSVEPAPQKPLVDVATPVAPAATESTERPQIAAVVQSAEPNNNAPAGTEKTTDIRVASSPVTDQVPDVPYAQTDSHSGVEKPGKPAVVRPSIGKPANTLINRNNGVVVNRAVNKSADIKPAEVAKQADKRPIAVNAQLFENSDDKPMVAIVLIDDGSEAISSEGNESLKKLKEFPYPVSIAVDTSVSDAADRMTLYRQNGIEVLAMIDMPQGAKATDVETVVSASLLKMPDVVGVLEGLGTGLQGKREVADQVAAILAQTGHGLVSQNRGLNTAPKLARKEGVPADPVFRDLDADGQNERVMRRALDQAAFRAGQEGGVVMQGRLRGETIAALALWGLEDRASSVAVAPISAVLLRDR